MPSLSHCSLSSHLPTPHLASRQTQERGIRSGKEHVFPLRHYFRVLCHSSAMECHMQVSPHHHQWPEATISRGDAWGDRLCFQQPPHHPAILSDLSKSTVKIDTSRPRHCDNLVQNATGMVEGCGVGMKQLHARVSISFNVSKWSLEVIYPPFTDEETELQSGKGVILLRSHSWEATELEFKS